MEQKCFSWNLGGRVHLGAFLQFYFPVTTLKSTHLWGTWQKQHCIIAYSQTELWSQIDVLYGHETLCP